MVLEYIKQYIDLLINGRLMDDVHDDIRTEAEKSKDYIYGQDILLPAATASKRIKKLSFTPYDQQGTSACGAFSAAHARLIESGERTDPLVWYRSRSNYSKPGMFLKEVLELIAYAQTFPKNSSAPSELTEEFANSLPYLPPFITKDKSREYFQIKPYDADGVFSAVTAGHPTLMTFFCTYDEWQDELVPKDRVWASTARVRHYVVALPNSAHSRDGYDWVSVVDSSPAHGYSLRHVRRDFIEQRMYLGGGFVAPSKVITLKPKSLPTRSCKYGDKSIDVLALQEYLVTQGLMSVRNMTSYYGNITARAVLDWQLQNIKGLSLVEIAELDGKNWGPKSILAVTNKHKNV